MATVKVVEIIDRAQIILQDTTGTRWAKQELLKFFNDAQREVVLVRPDAKTVNTTFNCAAGSKQTLPSAALRLLDVVRNVSGKAIRQIDRRIMDDQLPDWHNTPIVGTNLIEHYIYNPLDPKTFYLYPKPTNAAAIEIVYSSSPTTVTSTGGPNDLADIATTVIDIDDIYANAILDYLLYRAYSKDSEYAGNVARAQAHLQAFQNSLGIKTQSDSASTPRPRIPPGQAAQG
jgi:hypothetical protein